jgi:hypothetical protein
LREDLDHTKEEHQKLQVDRRKKLEPLERRRSSALEMKLTRSSSLSVIYNKNNMNKSNTSLSSMPARSSRIRGGGIQSANTSTKRCNPVAPKMVDANGSSRRFHNSVATFESTIDASCDDRDSDNDWVLSGDELGISENEEALEHDESGSSCSSDDDDDDDKQRKRPELHRHRAPCTDNHDESDQHRRWRHNATRSATTALPATFHRQTSFSKRSSTSSKHSGSDARRSATAAAKDTTPTANISSSRLVVDIHNLTESSISLLEEVSEFFGQNGMSTTQLIMSPSPRTERRKQNVQRQQQNDTTLSSLISPVSTGRALMTSAGTVAHPRRPQLQRANTAPTGTFVPAADTVGPSAPSNPTQSKKKKKKNSNEDGFLSPVVFAPSAFPANHHYHDPNGHTLLYGIESNHDLLDDEDSESQSEDILPGTSGMVESTFSQSDSNLLRDAAPQTRQRHPSRRTASTHPLQGSWCSLPTPPRRRRSHHFDPNHSLLISPTFHMDVSSDSKYASNNIDRPLDQGRSSTAPFRDSSAMDRASGKVTSHKTRRNTTTTTKPPKEFARKPDENNFASPSAFSEKQHDHESPTMLSPNATSHPDAKSREHNLPLAASLLSPLSMPPLEPIFETSPSSAVSMDLKSPLKQPRSRSKSPTRHSARTQSKSPRQQDQRTNKGDASQSAVLEFASTVGGSSKRQISKRNLFAHHNTEEISVVSASVGEKNDPLFQLLKTLLENDPSKASNGLSNFFVDGITDDASRNSRHTKYTITTKITISAAPHVDEGDPLPPLVEWASPSGPEKKKKSRKKSSKASSRTPQREKSSTTSSSQTARRQSEIFQSSLTAMGAKSEVTLSTSMASPSSTLLSSEIEDMFQHDRQWPPEWLEPKPSSSKPLKSQHQHHHRDEYRPESPSETQGEFDDDASPRSAMAFDASFDNIKATSYKFQQIHNANFPKFDSRLHDSAPASFFVGAGENEQKQANSVAPCALQSSTPHPTVRDGNKCSSFCLKQDVDSIRYGYETTYWHDIPNAAADEGSTDSPRYGLLKNSQMASDASITKNGLFSSNRRFSLESGTSSHQCPDKQPQLEGKGQRRFSLDSTRLTTTPVADAMGSKDRPSRKKRKDKMKKRIRLRRLSLDSRLKDKANPESATSSGEDRYSKTKQKPRRMSLPSTLPSYPGSGMAHAAKEVMKFVLRPAKKIVKSSRSVLARSRSPTRQRQKRPTGGTPLDTDIHGD